jgi:signal transduction histidine kinase
VEDQSPTGIKEIKKQLSSSLEELAIQPIQQKPLRFTKSSFEKKLFSSLRGQAAHKEIYKKYLFKEELRNLLLTTTEAKDLPRAILSLSSLKSFESAHVLVHEKGKPVGQNYFYTQTGFEEIKLISIKSFNSLYNLVKKSKNKIFTQTLLLNDDLEVVGNFLAKEIDLKNYSVIYLISRNSFLPPDQDEQDLFQSLSHQFQPLLMKILNNEKNDLQKDVLKKSLDLFPEKIIVKKDDQILFNNQSQRADNNDSHLMVFPLEGSDHTVMELSNLSKDAISTEIYHSRRVSLLGELLNTLQHELSNPLFGLNLTASLLSADCENEEVKETLTEICHNANRSQTIIKNFSNLYGDHSESKRIKIYKFIEEVITLTKSETKEIQKKIQVVGFDYPQEIEIETNPTCLTQIIFNLIINAAQAIKSVEFDRQTSLISIVLEKIDGGIKIAVIDNGPGVKSEIINAIFDAFFTTKESGTGLGLSICQNLANQLGTKIHFQNNSPFPGATFSLNLPIT